MSGNNPVDARGPNNPNPNPPKAAGDTSAAKPVKPKTKREVPFVAQLTPTDCGAASLSAVLSYYGKEIPIHAVRTSLGGGRNGVTARQLLTAARQFGLRARAVNVELDKLPFLPPASILHWDLNHFVVFEKANKKGVVIVDPGMGRRVLKMEDVSKSLSGVGLLLEPGEGFDQVAGEKRSRFGRYANWILGHRGIWQRLLLTSMFLQLIALSVPGLMGALVDKVVPRADVDLLSLVSAGFLSIGAFYFLTTFLRTRLLLHLRTKVEASMSMDFVEHLLALPYTFFQQRTTGDLMMRLSSQTAIREILTSGALSAMLDGAMVTVYLVLLVGAAPILALVALGIVAVQVAIYLVAGRRNAALMVESLAAQARLEGYQVEMLAGIETLKSMGAADRAQTRWSDLYVISLNNTVKRGELDGMFSALIGVLRFCGPISLMLTGAHLVLVGELSLGTMLGLSALGAGFLEPVANLVNTGMKLAQLKGYMERIEDVLDTPTEPKPAQGSAPVTRLVGSIKVDGLAFAYPSEPRPTLQGITLEIQPGERVAIVGASGSGKSTLARLLAGLYEPGAGNISYDDVNVKSWDLNQLRERLGIVTQDTRLFSGTIRDNLTLFDPAVPQDDVERSVRLAALDLDIARMPMGYDTVLADGGSSLSGGQRQRVSLARALLRRPTILVLDEATSALDTVTEALVQERLKELKCTQVIVAHRLSTVMHADKIVVLDQGRMIAVGNHDELMRRSREYQYLVRAQQNARPEAVPPVTSDAMTTKLAMPEPGASQEEVLPTRVLQR
ncbi:MAG: peptidase domain-containing ABC transporter [Myxococcales bacterium]